MTNVPAHELRIRRVEAEIRHLMHERVYILDVDGTILFRSEGVERTVFIPDTVAHGRLALHNHPNGESFSRVDVQIFLPVRAAEFRVVTDRYRFRLQEGGTVQWQHVEELVGQLYFEELEIAVNRFRTGAAPLDEASRDILHRVWERVAGAYGWQYRREEFGDEPLDD